MVRAPSSRNGTIEQRRLIRRHYTHMRMIPPMPSSSARQRIIRSILADGEIRSQNDIVDLLAEKGFTVTQATVSRDLASIGARKDGSRYVLHSGDDDQDGAELALAG